jgi:hypothetical protein
MVNMITDGGGHTIYGIKEYVVDKESDVKDLPTNAKAGSTAICIETSSVYMINSSREWVKL